MIGSNSLINQFRLRLPSTFSGGSAITRTPSIQCMSLAAAMNSAMVCAASGLVKGPKWPSS
jgi:hypothetical protein